MIGWLRGIYFSSIVIEVIRTISSFHKKHKINNFPPPRNFAVMVFCSLVFILLVGFGLIYVFVHLKFFVKEK